MLKSLLTMLIVIACTAFSTYLLTAHYYHRSQAGDVRSSTLQSMERGGTVSGRIVDSNGNPIARERVYAVSETFGERGAYRVRQSGTLTDTAGNYRIQRLTPGDYIISIGPAPEGDASIKDEKRTYYVKRYYPGTYTKENAKVIAIRDGMEVNGIDFTAGERKNTVEIHGRVIDGDTGQPIAGVMMDFSVASTGSRAGVGGAVVMGSTIYSSAGTPSKSMTDAKGEFILSGVVPGRYYITQRRQGNADQEYYAEPAETEVADQNITDLVVKLRRGGTISGKIEVLGTKDPAILGRVMELRISASTRPKQGEPLVPGDMTRNATVGSDGMFMLKGIKPGTVHLNLQSSSRDGGVFQLDRIAHKDTSVGHEGVEVGAGENLRNLRVILVYGAITVRGSVAINGKLPEATRLQLIVSRQENASSLSKFVDIGADGQFIVTNLATGTYTFRLQLRPIAAVHNEEEYKRISDALFRATQTLIVSEQGQQPINIKVDL